MPTEQVSSEERAAPAARSRSWWRRARAVDSAIAYLFILPALLIIFTFQYLPAFDVFRLSLTNRLLLRPNSKFIGLDNFKRLFEDERFWNSVWNTFYFVAGSVPLQIILALVLAIALSRKLRTTGLFRTIFFLPVVSSMVAVSVVWEWLYHPSLGVINEVITSLGGSAIPWLQSKAWAMPAIILLVVWKGTGYYMVIYLAGLMDIPSEYYEAARIDGASRWSLFRHITWPLLAPTTYLIMILQVINSFQVFTVVYVMTGGGPVRSTEVALYYMYDRAFQSLEFGYASAISVVVFLFLVLVTIFQRVFVGNRVSYDR
jgi:multiple sugar transport system permease protein